MRFDNLQHWLDWQTELHGQVIELGLERVAAVAERLQFKQIADKQIVVAGTNGKGSTVAAYEHWLLRQGYTTGCYTSPHILKYNERIRLNGDMVSDGELCEAFEAVDQAREKVSLTYFEFGTLAAFWLINQQQPDFAILEVGLGGRLDAVNVLDADLAHLTPIGLDHQAWLGDDREAIGFEKAGVLRPAIPVIVSDPDPPQSVLQQINKQQCRARYLGSDYRISEKNCGEFVWETDNLRLDLHSPLAGKHQMQNLAGVVAGLDMLLDLGNFDRDKIRDNFEGLKLAGRFQQVMETPRLFVDVGHNEDAARVQADCLAEIKRPGDRVTVVLGMLEDKDSAAFVSQFGDIVDHWQLISLHSERGMSAAMLEDRLDGLIKIDRRYDSAEQALDQLLLSATDDDIILVTGSFVTVETFSQALLSKKPA